ncbi:hypothetical protein P7K49_039643, partial [Saguinus oedipus]
RAGLAYILSCEQHAPCPSSASSGLQRRDQNTCQTPLYAKQGGELLPSTAFPVPDLRLWQDSDTQFPSVVSALACRNTVACSPMAILTAHRATGEQACTLDSTRVRRTTPGTSLSASGNKG